MTTATASSVQREPSMEEILASIRRIIEDSDPGRKGADETDETPLSAANTVDGAAMPEARAGFAPAPSDEQPLQAANADPITDDWQREFAAAAVSAAAPSAQQEQEVPRAPVIEARETDAPEIEASGIEAEPGPAHAAGGGIQPRSPLVSQETSRQVAAAFGELSEAFASRSRRSVDEMAAEMLRPMLQDWLDNNLPTLVERLVREEIERVARSG